MITLRTKSREADVEIKGWANSYLENVELGRRSRVDSPGVASNKYLGTCGAHAGCYDNLKITNCFSLRTLLLWEGGGLTNPFMLIPGFELSYRSIAYLAYIVSLPALAVPGQYMQPTPLGWMKSRGMVIMGLWWHRVSSV